MFATLLVGSLEVRVYDKVVDYCGESTLLEPTYLISVHQTQS